MRRSKNVQQMREFFVAGINYNDKPHKATMQRLNPPMGVRCHTLPGRANNPFGMSLCIRMPESYKTNTSQRM